MPAPNRPKALLFDVFGTVVDWRSTVTAHLTNRASAKLNSPNPQLPTHTRTAASTISWADFAHSWRASYTNFCHTYEPSATFTTVDQHFHTSLQHLLQAHDLEALWTADEVLHISRIWHTLDPWADSCRGLKALYRMGLRTCTLSNGNKQLLEDLNAYAGLPFTDIFSAEHFTAYKPAPETYLGAVERLGLRPGECAMVAAHLGDLEAARRCGLGTVYVEREGEEAWGVERVGEARREGWVGLWVGVEERDVGGGILEVVRLLERW